MCCGLGAFLHGSGILHEANSSLHLDGLQGWIHLILLQFSILLILTNDYDHCKMFCFEFFFHTKGLCTVKTAKKVSMLAAFVLFAFNVQLVFLRATRTDSNGEKTCMWVDVLDGYRDIYHQIDAFLYSFIPLLVMFTANWLIILKFMIAKWRNRDGGTESVNQALSKSAVNGSVMLLSVSFAFVILTGPICLYSIFVKPRRLFYGIAAILQYLNHSINGVLYCISGSRFRRELMGLFRSICCGKKEQRPVV